MKLTTLLLSFLLSTVGIANSNAEVVFLEQNGLVVMEAESVDVVWPWMLESYIGDFTGDAYFRFDGNSVETGPPNGTLSYKFYIETPGSYRMALRGNKDNSDPTLSNDCYTRLAGHTWPFGETLKTYLSGAPNQWSYNTMLEVAHDDKRTPRYNFEQPGVYELQVNGRSKGYYFDRIVLWHESKVSFSEAETGKAEMDALPSSAMGAPPTVIPGDGTTTSAQVTGLTLISADVVGQPFFHAIANGDTIDFAKTGTTALSAVALTSGTVEYVTFKYDGTEWSESGAPYAMMGNNGLDYTAVPYLQNVGEKTVTVSVFTSNTVSPETSVFTFTLIDSGSDMTTQAPVTAPTTTAPVAATTMAPVNSVIKAPVVTTTTPTVEPTATPTKSPEVRAPAALFAPTLFEAPTTAELPATSAPVGEEIETPASGPGDDDTCDDECSTFFGLVQGHKVSKTWFGSFCTERCSPMASVATDFFGYNCGPCP